MYRIKELEKLISFHNDMYYNSNAVISDDEFDLLVKELQNLDVNNLVLKKIGSPVISKHWEKINHEISMGSLFKASDINEFKHFFGKFKPNNYFVVMEKYDGISISLNYVNGELVEAITRGDGFIGENIIRNVRKMQNVVFKTASRFTGSVRGEIIMTGQMFKKANELRVKKGLNVFSNPRNAASGIARELEGYFCKFLTIKSYDVVSENKDFLFETDKIEYLGELGISRPFFALVNDMSSIEDIYNNYIDNVREKLPYAIDGLVIKVNDIIEAKLFGVVDNRPKYQIALKFPSLSVGSTVKDIHWSVTRTGRVNPKVEIEPVEIDGSVITFASLHNNKIFESLGLKKDSEVIIKKAGDIIPQITEVVNVGNGCKFLVPDKCPSCGGVLSSENRYIYCVNQNCADVLKAKIVYFFKTLSVEGLSDGIIDKFFNAKLNPLKNINEWIEVFLEFDGNLSMDEWLSYVEGVGYKTFENIFNSFYGKMKKQNNLKRIIEAFGINGLGKANIDKIWPVIENEYSNITFENIENILISNIFKYFSKITHEKISRYLKHNIKEIVGTLSHLSYFVKLREGKINRLIKGKTFCITGKLKHKSRQQYIDLIEKNGGIYKKTIIKDLNFLVANEKNAGSSKTIKAKIYYIDIITEDHLNEMLGLNKRRIKCLQKDYQENNSILTHIKN